MTAHLLKGRPVARSIYQEMQPLVASLTAAGHQPHLAVLLVGDNKASASYVEKKRRAAQRHGILCTVHKMPATATQQSIVENIKYIQRQSSLSGLIVQLPLSDHIDEQTVLDIIDPALDVDCLTTVNMRHLAEGTATVAPPTPLAILSLLKEAGVSNYHDRFITVVGAGKLVGAPLATMLRQLGATVSLCTKETPDTAEQCRRASIVISATGVGHLITETMVRDGAIVIDAGVSYHYGTMYGDVDLESVKKKAAAVTPTPNGVGPVTVAHLLKNTVLSAERKWGHV